MKTRLMTTVLMVCAALGLSAMPTKEETKRAVPIVQKLMAPERAALDAGKKTRSEVAAAAMKLADGADTDAAKLLLMKGAFVLYVKDGQLEKAVEAMNTIEKAITDLPPQSVTNMIELALLGVSKKEDGTRLYRLLDAAKKSVGEASPPPHDGEVVQQTHKDRTTVQSIIDGMIKVPGHDFWLAETELTQGQWEAVMGNNPAKHKGANLPVENVSRDDCDAFLMKLNQTKEVRASQFEFCLPGRVEWAGAARAGSGNETKCIPYIKPGVVVSNILDMAWLKDNSGGQTHAVATKAPNAWGFYDMVGNVSEQVIERPEAGCERGYSFVCESSSCKPGRFHSIARNRREPCYGLRVAAHIRTAGNKAQEEKKDGGVSAKNAPTVLTGPYGIRIEADPGCEKGAEYILKRLADVYLPSALKYFGDPFAGMPPTRVFTVKVKRNDGSDGRRYTGPSWGSCDDGINQFTVGLAKGSDEWEMDLTLLASKVLTVCRDAGGGVFSIYVDRFVTGDVKGTDPIPELKEQIRQGLAKEGDETVKDDRRLWLWRKFAPMWTVFEQLRAKHPTFILDYCKLKNARYAEGKLPATLSMDQMAALLGEVTGENVAELFKEHGVEKALSTSRPQRSAAVNGRRSGDSVTGKVPVAQKLLECDFLLNKDFKKDAKFYLCLFSASWCGPCRREMPRLAKTYAETLKADPDIELIHFSRDQDDEKALAWAKEHDVKFPVVKPNGGNPLNLRSRGIPHLFVVKADGTLVEEGHPASLFTDEKLRSLKAGEMTVPEMPRFGGGLRARRMARLAEQRQQAVDAKKAEAAKAELEAKEAQREVRRQAERDEQSWQLMAIQAELKRAREARAADMAPVRK